MAQARIFTPEQARRYSRNIAISQIGEKGQRKLLDAKVLLIGAGGLGSPAAIYLAAAGVGTLGIMDPDVVDITNLQRQILHHNHDIGRPKVVSAAETIADINPDVQVIQHQLRLSSENAWKVLRPYDIVLDCSDNFPTRYLLNDACVMLGKPWVHGSIFAMDGQASTFVPGEGCYRCLYPMPSPPGMVPSGAVVGVLGAAPGIIGSIQAV
ncbi:MAG: HesA/MoeB/ThiF family protein, partial [Chloroflexota bacterium]